MSATAVTITPDGWLTDVDMGDPDLRAEHIRRLIGVAAVHALTLSVDLVMWVADGVNGSPLNAAATDLVMLAADIPNQTIYGTVVLTGGTADGSDVRPIPGTWAKYIANHQAVRPVETARPDPVEFHATWHEPGQPLNARRLRC